MKTVPAAEPIAESDLRERALATMQLARFPILSTVDGPWPRARPVSPVLTEGFVVYVANLKRYHKTQELAANPRAELCYFAENHHQVRISGLAGEERDPELIRSIWAANPLLRKYLGEIDNPDWNLYRITPCRVRYMEEWALIYHEVPLEEPTGQEVDQPVP